MKSFSRRIFIFAAAACFVPLNPARGEDIVRVQGLAPLSRILKAAAPALRRAGIEIKTADESGNSQAIAALGAGTIDFALLGRKMTAEEEVAYPDCNFHQFEIGTQTLAVVVSRVIWESGVRALKKEQILRLYEGKIETWEELGGEKRSAKFFEPAHGQGVWEVFAGWLYGDVRKAPAVPWEVVADAAQAQNAVQFQSGAASVVPLRWADRRDVFPLAILDESGAAIEPTLANIAKGAYPLSRVMYVVAGQRPTTAKRKVIGFFESEEGRALIKANDLLPIEKAGEK